jgi:hypothetical protein
MDELHRSMVLLGVLDNTAIARSSRELSRHTGRHGRLR